MIYTTLQDVLATARPVAADRKRHRAHARLARAQSLRRRRAARRRLCRCPTASRIAPRWPASPPTCASTAAAARLLRAEAVDEDFAPLFDRRAEFGALLAEIGALRPPRDAKAAQEALRHTRRLRKAFDQLVAIDFFAGEAQRQTAAALQTLEAAVASAQSPDEPHAAAQRRRAPARPRRLPRPRLGHAPPAVGRSPGQRLADPPLHRPGRRDSCG